VVAAGLASVSIGTETNGSLLIPASRNDVYAMKPTLGLVDAEGIVPICREFDSAGPIARCAADIAHLMDVMLSPAKSEHLPESRYRSQLTGSLQGLRIGVLDPADWHLPGVVANPAKISTSSRFVARCYWNSHRGSHTIIESRHP